MPGTAKPRRARNPIERNSAVISPGFQQGTTRSVRGPSFTKLDYLGYRGRGPCTDLHNWLLLWQRFPNCHVRSVCNTVDLLLCSVWG